MPDASTLPDGRIVYGAFDSAGRLTGTIHDVCHDQWWGGRRVAASDISAVAVLPEARGTGTARAMLKAVLEGAHERGAAVSALYPTAGAVYSASGWAFAGQLRTLELPAALLATVPALQLNGARTLTLRPADPGGADQPAVCDLYNRVARAREGLLTRSGPGFAEDSFPKGIDGMTLAYDEDSLVGYASWMRGTGYRAEALLDVPDLLAVTTEAARELLAVLAGWRSVTPTVRLRPLDFDPITPLLPREAGSKLDTRPWMHRPVDVARALSSRGWPLSRRGRGHVPSARPHRLVERRGLAVRRRRRSRGAGPHRHPSGAEAACRRLRAALLRGRDAVHARGSRAAARPGLLHQRPGADPSQIRRAAARLLLARRLRPRARRRRRARPSRPSAPPACRGACRGADPSERCRAAGSCLRSSRAAPGDPAAAWSRVAGAR